jgi:hypothetical protein
MQARRWALSLVKKRLASGRVTVKPASIKLRSSGSIDRISITFAGSDLPGIAPLFTYRAVLVIFDHAVAARLRC